MERAGRLLLMSCSLQLRSIRVEPSFVFVMVIQPLVFLLMSHYLSAASSGTRAAAWGLVGASLVGMWNTTVWSSGFLVEQERWGSTLELLLAAPMPWQLALTGKSLANACISLVSMLCTIVAARTLGGVDMSDPIGYMLVLVLSLVALTVLGVLLGGMFTLSRHAGQLATALNYPIFVLTGLFFPLDWLPGWVRPLSDVLAPTWTAAGLRVSLSAVGLPTLQCAALLTLTALYGAASWLAYSYLDRQVRTVGNLASY